MYFIKINKLKEDIREKRFGEKDRFIYAFIYIFLNTLFIEFSLYFPIEESNIWDNLDSVCTIVITAVGTYYAYRANGGKNGTDFLGRFFSINFVVGIRFLLLLIPMFACLFAYYIYVLPEDHDLLSTPIDTIPFIIWFALLYIRTCKHIRDIKDS